MVALCQQIKSYLIMDINKASNLFKYLNVAWYIA